ncbi:hypothetical protein AGMMS49593_00790 [Endomicrobiia bacterium]|nr:hypothetical protein AGMMS49593_00790 [Endomicrobiia bacterium]
MYSVGSLLWLCRTCERTYLKNKKKIKVNHIIATGGLAGLILSEIKEIKVILPNLTLEGIRIIWEKNNRRIQK